MITIGKADGRNFAMPNEAATQKFAILAVSGAGKTYTGKVMAEEMLQSEQQVVILDPLGVWHGLRSSADGKAAGYSIIIVGGEHQDVPLEVASGRVLANFVIDSGHSVILDLSSLRTKADEIRFAYEFCEELYRRKNRETSPLHLFLDEADMFAPQKPGPDQTKLLGSLENIVRRGRAKGLGVTLITQRSAVLNKNVLTQIETLIVLRTIAPQDRGAIEEWISYFGTPEDRKTIMSSLAGLTTGQAWVYSPAWLRLCSLVQVRQLRTFDSSSTPKVGARKVSPQRKAEVDLAVLKTELSATIERAKENDPTELKKKIIDLERQLKAKPTVAIDQSAIDKAVKLALTTTEKQNREIGQKLRKAHTALHQWKTNTNDVIQAVLDALGVSNQLERGILVNGGDLLKIESLKAAPAPVATPAPVRKESAPQYSEGEVKIGEGAKKRILTVLAQYGKPCTDKKVGAIAGIVSSGGHFKNELGALKRAGFVEGERSALRITDLGLEALGDYDPLPTGASAIDDWKRRLGSPESAHVKIFTALCDAYPDTLTKAQIGEITGLDGGGGHFKNCVGYLRTRDLIEGKSDLKASPSLFEV